MHVQLDHALRVGHHVIHVAGMMVAGIGAAMHRGEGIEVRARAAAIHGAAIALLMYVETMRAVGGQSAHRTGEMHATGAHGHQRDLATDQAAGSGSQVGGRLLRGAQRGNVGASGFLRGAATSSEEDSSGSGEQGDAHGGTPVPGRARH